jgi:hypothetical protein
MTRLDLRIRLAIRSVDRSDWPCRDGRGAGATYLAVAVTGIGLARAAGQGAKRAGVLALAAEALVLEAHGHARAGGGRACATALHAAEKTLDRADRSADPQWMSYFDEAYLSAKFGHCLRALGQTGAAERFAARSLKMDNRYVRGRAFNLALLASVYAHKGEPDRACAVGSEALTSPLSFGQLVPSATCATCSTNSRPTAADRRYASSALGSTPRSADGAKPGAPHAVFAPRDRAPQ